MVVGEVQALNVIAVESMERGDLEDAARILTEAVYKLTWCSLQPTPIAEADQDQQQQEQQEHGSNHSPQQDSVIVYCACDDDDDDDYNDVLDEDEDVEMRMGASSSSSTATALPFLGGINRSNKPLRSRAGSQEDEEEEAPFFSKPFLFECNTSMMQDEEAHPVSTQEYTCGAMTCLFNLGLCFQTQWQRKEPRPAALIQRALHFYEQALSLLTPAMVQQQCPSSSSYTTSANNSNERLLQTILHLLMALCTNALHCQVELANYAQVHLWTARLQHCLKLHHQHCAMKAAEEALLSSNATTTCTTKRTTGSDHAQQQQQQHPSRDDHPLFALSKAKIQFFSRKAFFNDFVRVAAHAA